MGFFFSSRRRHTSSLRDWSSDVCSSDLNPAGTTAYTNTASITSTCATTCSASAIVNVTATPALTLKEIASPLPLPLTAINVTAGGSGYTSPPSVSISGCSVAPTAVATVAGGVVTGVTITNGGAGRTAPATSLG